LGSKAEKIGKLEADGVIQRQGDGFPLERTLNLFSLENINGFVKISELLASVTAKGR